MEFFVSNRPMIKIRKNIYQPFYDMLCRIKETSYHYELFMKGEGREAFALEELFAFQKTIFNIETEEKNDFKFTVVNNVFMNGMAINLEIVRADMYGIKPEKQYIHPIEYRTYKIK